MASKLPAGTDVIVTTKNWWESRTFVMHIALTLVFALSAFIEVILQANAEFTLATVMAGLLSALAAIGRSITDSPITFNSGPIAAQQIGGTTFTGSTTADVIAGGQIVSLDDNKEKP